MNPAGASAPALVAALPEEAAAFPPRVVVPVSGSGALAAARAVMGLAARGARAVVFIGCAGGVRPDQRVGDLVICSRFLAQDGSAPLEADPGLVVTLRRACAASGLVFETGASLTVSRLVTTPERKRACADRGAAAVEMENHAAALAAREAGVAFAALRCVIDGSATDLGPVLPLFREDVEIGAAVALGHALRHPGALPLLWRLRRASRRVARNLARVGLRLVATTTRR
ncbi:MAG: hypothetical protein HY722_09390 [Planctomycetes bacterium]|nr:hypothetical protein [Planctomycetota bacterium]